MGADRPLRVRHWLAIQCSPVQRLFDGLATGPVVDRPDRAGSTVTSVRIVPLGPCAWWGALGILCIRQMGPCSATGGGLAAGEPICARVTPRMRTKGGIRCQNLLRPAEWSVNCG